MAVSGAEEWKTGEVLDRNERRYLVADAELIEKLLGIFGKPDLYHVHSVYLDHPGPKDTHYRLRFYDDQPHPWLERKTQNGKRVTKQRTQRMDLGRKDIPAGYDLMGVVDYDREAWDLSIGRITVDRNVKTGGKALPYHVVEVKGEDVPPWLDPFLPPRAKDFSKRNWMLTGKIDGGR